MERWPAPRPLGGAAVTLALASLSATLGCSDFTTARTTPPRGTLGTGLYALICDRVGAQALPEDITGGSYYGICHPDPTTGAYTATVDTSLLPPLEPGAVDVDGNPVSIATQEANRTYDIARIESLGRDRTPIIGALDSAIPDIQIAVKDLDERRPDAVVSPRLRGRHGEPAYGSRADGRQSRRPLRRPDDPAAHRGDRPRARRGEGIAGRAVCASREWTRDRGIGRARSRSASRSRSSPTLSSSTSRTPSSRSSRPIRTLTRPGSSLRPKRRRRDARPSPAQRAASFSSS